jgi:cobyrinic acid a,c-diamide synthase
MDLSGGILTMFERPRIMVAGERSGVGKSTITIGIIAALRARGLDVQPFKVGPDFLDPMHHNAVSVRTSRNLDTWMFPHYVEESFLRNSEGADISVIEGVMGFYDGYDGRSELGSSAHLSKVLQCPVALVLNASSSARSMGAVAKGFVDFDPDVDIEGIIFNKVGGKRHLEMLDDSLRGVSSLGGLPRQEEVGLKSRHLGLVPAQEEDNASRYEAARKMVEENLDLDGLVEMAREAPPLRYDCPIHLPKREPTCKIGVALDAAFNFYYADNFDLLRAAGAEIVPFSPMRDKLPEVDGVYLGGGYPELFAAELSKNRILLDELRSRAGQGLPVYAECGGLMYLCESLIDLEGAEHRMSSIFKAKVEMTQKLQALGYIEAKTTQDNILTMKGDRTRGHVFHYSHIAECDHEEFAYVLDKDKGIGHSLDGMVADNCLASYTHLHFGTDPKLAENFVRSCLKGKRC